MTATAIGDRRFTPELGTNAERGNQDVKRNSIVAWCLMEVIWAVLAVEFIGASTAEVASDSVRVHLPYMLRVIADHGLSHQYACWYRLQPMAVQTYGAAIAAVGSVAAAKWFSWLALAVLALLLAEEVERRGGSRELGLFAGAAELSCPLLARLSSSLYVDHVLAMLCTAGFVVLFRALRPPCLRGILLSAAIMGSLVQVKYTGLIFAVVWGLFLAAVLWRRCGWRAGLWRLLLAGGLLAALAMPWYVYVYLGTGNPFYPFLQRWFPSPYWVDNLTLQQVFEQTSSCRPASAALPSFPGWPPTAPAVSSKDTTAFSVSGPRLDAVLVSCVAGAGKRAGRESSGQNFVCPICFSRQTGILPHRVRRPARRRDPCYWDMAVVGVAMIAGVAAYTPYVRYWLPAYPLLVAACVLAAGRLLPSLHGLRAA